MIGEWINNECIPQSSNEMETPPKNSHSVYNEIEVATIPE